jgi:hypothetical protein
MAVRKVGKREEYIRYAQHCLELVRIASSQSARVTQREMAAEWLKLANTVRHRSRPTEMQME